MQNAKLRTQNDQRPTAKSREQGASPERTLKNSSYFYEKFRRRRKALLHAECQPVKDNQV